MTNKRILCIVLIALSLPLVTNASPPAVCSTPSPVSTTVATNGAVARHLIAAERASWNLAIQRNVGTYRALHAPDFITVTGGGEVDKATSEASAMDAKVRFDQCVLSGFDVRRVAPNAALITYHTQAAGLDHGRAFRLDSYASSLWIKRNGAWLNVFYQATPASK